MKKRTLFMVVAGVTLAHAGLLVVLKDLRPLPRGNGKKVPPPNFTVRSTKITLPETGEKRTHREYTVSTRLERQPRFE